MENKQVIVSQSVRSRLTDEYACILLSVNKMTKEERLLGLILAELDGEGKCEIINASREHLCSVCGIAFSTWRVYISKWEKMGLMEVNKRKWTFKKYLHNSTQGILITGATNGMVVSKQKS